MEHHPPAVFGQAGGERRSMPRKRTEENMEDLEKEALAELMEHSAGRGIESIPAAEALYNKLVKDPRSEKAREWFRRPVYALGK